jgi:hypothetical protein
MTGCGVNLNSGKFRADGYEQELCGKEAIYRAWTANCRGCLAFSDDGCVGHPVCLEHGMVLRTTALQDVDEEAILLRICTLEGQP